MGLDSLPKSNSSFHKVASKFANFRDVFSLKLVIKLTKYTSIKNHIMELINDRKLSYGFINSLGQIE